MPRLLVVDDKEMLRDSLHATLSRAGHEVTLAPSAPRALELIAAHPFDVIVSDLKMPKMDGIAFLEELRRRSCDIPLIIMTAYATIATAVEAMRKGAFDYIQKPFDADEICLLIDRALEHRRLLQENEAFRTSDQDHSAACRIIGSGPAMNSVLEKVKLIAQSSATVLIRGESGTGKELIARAIHDQSPRADKPFLAVNCAALSGNLLESELFGHEKGAFTGADRMRKGRFELAEGGTLLLDEISEMNLQLQAKLLRVLQERTFERVGSSLTRSADVRVLATTNRPLEDWVRENKFREDLFYRLNVVPVEVPPLRRRLHDDLEDLCRYFLSRSSQRETTPLRRLSPDALDLLRCYHWPGNVRELENLMERVSILVPDPVITARHLEGWIDLDHAPAPDPDELVPLRSCKLEDVERIVIEKTLEKYQGHRQKTAEALGIGVRTLGMKIKRWKQEQSVPA